MPSPDPRLVSTHIRRATAADAAALAALAARTFSEAFSDGSSADDLALHLANSYSPALQGAELADPDIDTLLVLVDDALAGFAQLRAGGTAPPCVEARSPVELWRFYVDRPWHGGGLAQLLMRAVVAAGRRRDADALWLSVWEHNPRAQAFYAKSAFRQAGSKAFVVGTDVQTDWVMVRALRDDDGERYEVRDGVRDGVRA